MSRRRRATQEKAKKAWNSYPPTPLLKADQQDLYQDIHELEELLLRYDPRELLPAVSFMQFAIGRQLAEERRDCGLAAIAEYAALLRLKHDEAGPDYEHITEDILMTIDIQARSIMDRTATVHLDKVKPKSNEVHRVYERALGSALWLRGRRYGLLVKQQIQDLFAPFDDVLLAARGITTEDVLHAVGALERMIMAKQRLKHLSEDEWLFDGDEANERRGNARLAAREAPRLSSNSWHEIADIAAEGTLGVERVARFVEQFSLHLGDVSQRFSRPRGHHSLRVRPLVVLDGAVFVPSPPLLVDAVHYRLEGMLKEHADPKAWSLYTEHRARYLERRAIDLVSAALRPSVSEHSLRYQDAEGVEGEVDGLIAFDSNLIIIEAKSGSVPIESGLAFDLLRRTRWLLRDPQEQAVRAKRHIERVTNPHFTRPDGSVFVLDSSLIDQVLLITVTLEPMGELTTILSEAAAAGLLDSHDLPWAVELTDLQVICETVEFPSQFIHYLQQRQRIERARGVLAAVEELDWFGVYLSGMVVPEAQLRRDAPGLFVADATGPLDSHYSEYGFTTTGERPRQYLPPVLRDIIVELEAQRRPGWSHAVGLLLDIPVAQRDGLADMVEQVTRLSSADGHIHDASMADQGDFGVSVFGVPRGLTDEVMERAVAYCTLKKYQARARRWLFLALATEKPGGVTDWGLLDSKWRFDRALKKAVERLPSGRTARPGIRRSRNRPNS